jgi:chorismate-pyruvate lyase
MKTTNEAKKYCRENSMNYKATVQMKTLMRTSLLLTAALLSACATSPVTVSQSRAISPDRLLSGYSALAEPSPAKARVVVIRDEGMLGVAARAALIVDGVPVAKVWSGERVEFYLASGDHILAVRDDSALVGGTHREFFLVHTRADVLLPH